jgi:hypothetical protein
MRESVEGVLSRTAPRSPPVFATPPLAAENPLGNHLPRDIGLLNQKGGSSIDRNSANLGKRSVIPNPPTNRPTGDVMSVTARLHAFSRYC